MSRGIRVSLIWFLVALVAFVVVVGWAILTSWNAASDADDAAELAERAAQDNRNVLCAVGGLVIQATDVRRDPGESAREFRRELRAFQDFLGDLREIDCETVGFGPEVTPEALERRLERIEEALGEPLFPAGPPGEEGAGIVGPQGEQGEQGEPGVSPAPLVVMQACLADPACRAVLDELAEPGERGPRGPRGRPGRDATPAPPLPPPPPDLDEVIEELCRTLPPELRRLLCAE